MKLEHRIWKWPRSVILIPVLDLPQVLPLAGRCTQVLSPLQITSLLTLPHPSAFRVAQLTHVRRHARSKGTGHGDKSPTQAPGRFKNIRARRDALCVLRWASMWYTFGASRQNELLRGANQISYRNSNFCFRCYLLSDTYRSMMKEIMRDQICYQKFNP